MDPHVSYNTYDYNVMYNVYETLLWYNKSSPTDVVPWLAQNYTISADGKTANFALRSGIKFTDGESFNSTAAYFSLNRLLVEDGSSPTGHGVEASWIIQQLANASLST
ncbi:MAG: ABC transporter substrate-binding protein, partial [Thaumarchaeota archaeon]|nr:ABC transporter substrate-binding protein [Nitrososphaerota archaeon]